jgi:hypothetical protein
VAVDGITTPLGRLAQQFHPDPFRPSPWMLPAHLRDQHRH